MSILSMLPTTYLRTPDQPTGWPIFEATEQLAFLPKLNRTKSNLIFILDIVVLAHIVI